MTAVVRPLSGNRLHLQHGPIDLILWAEGGAGAREAAYAAAAARFDGLLAELVAELPALRQRMVPDLPIPAGETARRMDRAVRPLSEVFVTRMAAVAGAVADTALTAMGGAAPLRRAYVNNGGDIALHLSPGTRFDTAMMDHAGRDQGRIAIAAGNGIGGIATSGRHGRSLSLGIADSVTVLAADAARADAAATLIANAVDLPGHSAIRRQPACVLDPDSDLGDRMVVTGCGALSPRQVAEALSAGEARAAKLLTRGHILGAALFLQGQARVLGGNLVATTTGLVDA